MSWFLPVLLGSFLCMSAYVWGRLASATGKGCRAATLLALPFLLMPAGFVLVHLYGGGWPPLFSRITEITAGFWLVLVFWTALLLLPLDAWNLMVRLAGRLWAPAGRLRLPPAAVAVSALCGTAALCFAAMHAARRVEVNEVRIVTERLGYDVPPLRIVLLSDLHLGRTSVPATVNRVRDLVRDARPDLLLCAGDFCDHAGAEAAEQAAVFREIRPPLGKFAVLGNHEAYAGVDASVKILEGVGFRVLRDEAVPIREDWMVVGEDDPAAAVFEGLPEGADAWLLPKSRGRRFHILLKHRPDLTDKARNSADLQLSGHTHGGQVFPFGWLVHRLYPLAEDRLLPQAGGIRLYVSRGAGTWGAPLRLGAPPGITVITVEPKSFPDAGSLVIDPRLGGAL